MKLFSLHKIFIIFFFQCFGKRKKRKPIIIHIYFLHIQPPSLYSSKDFRLPERHLELYELHFGKWGSQLSALFDQVPAWAFEPVLLEESGLGFKAS